MKNKLGQTLPQLLAAVIIAGIVIASISYFAVSYSKQTQAVENQTTIIKEIALIVNFVEDNFEGKYVNFGKTSTTHTGNLYNKISTSDGKQIEYIPFATSLPVKLTDDAVSFSYPTDERVVINSLSFEHSEEAPHILTLNIDFTLGLANEVLSVDYYIQNT